MNIDLAIVLPELPEGLFWVVDWKRPDPRAGVRSEPVYGEMPKVLEVRICEPTLSSTIRTVPVVTPPSWRTLWMKRVSYEYKTYTEEGMKTLESGGLYLEAIFPGEMAVKEFNRGWQYVIEKSKAFPPNYFYAVKPMENTPENVLAVAERVYKKYNERLEDQEKKCIQQQLEKELIGIYPPKKLEL